MTQPDQDRSFLHRVVLLMTGWVSIAGGVVAVLHAGLGAGPFDVLNVGVAQSLGVQVGTASWVTTGVVLALAALLGARPGPATFAGAFSVGALVNVLLAWVPSPDGAVWRSVLLLGGAAVLYVGVSLVVIAGLGTGAIDLLMFAIGSKGVSLRIARWGIEAAAAGVGVLLGGTAGVATVLIAASIGPALVRLIPLVDRIAGRGEAVAAVAG
jgi:uncharacterized membrane protein YczE